jgi:hypothetical protein
MSAEWKMEDGKWKTGTERGGGWLRSAARNGKIARLPREVRERLNRRLEDGEQGKKLVVWLNEMPEVQAVLATEFRGKAINGQNLTEWRQGGYRDWLAQQE